MSMIIFYLVQTINMQIYVVKTPPQSLQLNVYLSLRFQVICIIQFYVSYNYFLDILINYLAHPLKLSHVTYYFKYVCRLMNVQYFAKIFHKIGKDSKVLYANISQSTTRLMANARTV